MHLLYICVSANAFSACVCGFFKCVCA